MNEKLFAAFDDRTKSVHRTERTQKRVTSSDFARRREVGRPEGFEDQRLALARRALARRGAASRRSAALAGRLLGGFAAIARLAGLREASVVSERLRGLVLGRSRVSRHSWFSRAVARRCSDTPPETT